MLYFLSLLPQRAFNALCHSTHLYGRRLVLEWADSEVTLQALRRKTAEHFHGKTGGDAERAALDWTSPGGQGALFLVVPFRLPVGSGHWEAWQEIGETRRVGQGVDPPRLPPCWVAAGWLTLPPRCSVWGPSPPSALARVRWPAWGVSGAGFLTPCPPLTRPSLAA